MGASWMFLYEAYHQIGVGVSSLLYFCGPVMVMILSPLIFKDMLTVPKIIGFLVVIVGIILVNGQAVTNGINTIGLVCGGMSAIIYFFMVTLRRRLKNGSMHSGEGFRLQTNTIFRWNPGWISRKIGEAWGRKARRLGVLTFFKQALIYYFSKRIFFEFYR